VVPDESLIHVEVKQGNNPIINILNWLEAQVGNDWQNNTKASDVTGVKQNGDGDLQATIKAVQFTGFMVTACIGVFVLLLNRFPAVFAHRALEEFDEDVVLPTPSPNNPLSWAAHASAVTDDDAMKLIGLDGIMLAKFLQMCKRVLMVVCPVIFCVLVPVHYCLGSRRMVTSKGAVVDMDMFSRFGIGTVTNTWDLYAKDPNLVADQEIFNRMLCWVHAALVFFVCGVTVFYISHFQREFLALRWKWLKLMGPPRSTTLLVEGIPPKHRSDQSLTAYFVKLFSEKAVHRAYVIRRTWGLRRQLASVERLEAKLQSAQEAWEASGRSEDARVDLGSFVTGNRGQAAIQQIERQLEEARAALREEREKMAEVEKSTASTAASTSGFVTFTSRRWCRLASREQLKADPTRMKLSKAPAMGDVRFDDLALDHSGQMFSRIMEISLTTLVFIMWIPITGIIASCTSLEELKGYRGMRFLNDLPPTAQEILEGVLAQLALKVVLAILPMLLMAIIETNFLISGNEAQVKMQTRYFMFLVVFVILVSAFSQTLVHTLKEIIADPRRVTVLLAKLPDSAHFYINYIVTAMFTLSMALIRISPFAKFLIFRSEDQTNKQVRESSEPEDQVGDGMGARYAKITHMMTVTLVFCHASPTVTIAALVWFVFAEYVYRWLTLYSEVKKPDLGGAFFDTAIHHVYWSLLLYVFIMLAVMLNAPWGPGLPSLAIMAAGAMVWNSFGHYTGVIWEQMPFETVVEQDAVRQASSSSSLMAEDRDQYVQEECQVPPEEAAQMEKAASAQQAKRSDGSN